MLASGIGRARRVSVSFVRVRAHLSVFATRASLRVYHECVCRAFCCVCVQAGVVKQTGCVAQQLCHR